MSKKHGYRSFDMYYPLHCSESFIVFGLDSVFNSINSVIFNAFGFDGPVTHKLFHFLNRQSDILHGRDDVALYAILAGLVLFSPNKSSRGIEILQSYQDELYDLLHAYCERYRSIDKSLVTKVGKVEF